MHPNGSLPRGLMELLVNRMISGAAETLEKVVPEVVQLFATTSQRGGTMWDTTPFGEGYALRRIVRAARNRGGSAHRGKHRTEPESDRTVAPLCLFVESFAHVTSPSVRRATTNAGPRFLASRVNGDEVR